MKCINCTKLNEIRKTQYSCNHAITDTKKYEYLKEKIKNYLTSVDYPVQPNIPTILPSILDSVHRPREGGVNI